MRLFRDLGGPGGYEIEANWLPLGFRAISRRKTLWGRLKTWLRG